MMDHGHFNTRSALEGVSAGQGMKECKGQTSKVQVSRSILCLIHARVVRNTMSQLNKIESRTAAPFVCRSLVPHVVHTLAPDRHDWKATHLPSDTTIVQSFLVQECNGQSLSQIRQTHLRNLRAHGRIVAGRKEGMHRMNTQEGRLLRSLIWCKKIHSTESERQYT